MRRKTAIYFIVVFIVVMVLMLFGYIFLLPRLINNNSQAFVNSSFPQDLSTKVIYSKSDDLTWEYGGFIGIVKDYGQSEGIKYMNVEYVGADGNIQTVKVHISGVVDRLRSTMDFAKDLKKEEGFTTQYVERKSFYMKKTDQGDEKEKEYIDFDLASEKILTGTGIMVVYLSKFPDSNLLTKENCQELWEACLMTKAVLALDPQVNDFWAGKVVDENNYIFPLYLSLDLEK